MTLNRLVSSLFLAATLSLGSCGADESTSVQCKQGRVPYQGQCCPDDNSNGICDWVDNGDAYGGEDLRTFGDTYQSPDTTSNPDISACTNECLKANPSGQYCMNSSTLIVCGDCNSTPTAQPCPSGTNCYDGECK